MPSLSNRYPAAQRGSPVRQSRPRPLPRSFPKPDNDNTPGTRKPLPVPDNDNRPGRPRFPAPSTIGRTLARRSAYGLAALAVMEVVKDALSPWFYTNLQAAFMAGWQVDLRCRDGSPQWIGSNPFSCAIRQAGLTPKKSVSELIASYRPTVLNDMTQLYGPYPHHIVPSINVWDDAINYSRTGSQSLPEFDQVPWPEYLPLPDPDYWPVGLPYPVRPPAVRPGAPPASAGGKSTRDSSSPGTRNSKQTAFDPFPRRPRKGEKEGKIKSEDDLMAIFGRGLGTYSEIGDFIDSLWEALPDYYRTSRYGEYRYRGHRTVPIHDKFNDIYRNIEHMDWTQAVKNLIYNEVQDQIVGRMIGRTTKVFGKNLGNALIAGLRGI